MALINHCPFCGATAECSRIPGGGFSMICSRCGAIAAPAAAGTRDDTIAAWNRRVVRPNFQRADDVKPCPFCASRAAIAKLPSDASILKCQNCGMMVSFADSTSLAATLEHWNRRQG